MSKTVAVAELAAHLAEMLEEVQETKEEVVVLSEDGQPMVTVSAFSVSIEERRRKPLEELRKKYPVQIVGDIVEPLDDEWDVMK